MKEFNNISKKEMVSSGVRSLPDRPNAYSKYGAGALTAAQLKEAFDKLAELVAGRVNDIISSLKDGTFSEYVKPPDLLTKVGVDSLLKLLEGILDGEFANILCVREGEDKKSLSQKLIDESARVGELFGDIKDIDEKISGLKGGVDDIDEKISGLTGDISRVDTAHGELKTSIEDINSHTVGQLSYDALTGKLTITSTNEQKTYEVNLPLEVTVQRGYYDSEERCIVIVLTSGDEVRISVDDLDAEAFESRLEEITRASVTKAGLRDAVVVNGEVRYPSEGLEYEKGEYGLTYTVVGLGTCTDKNIVVPRMYNGFPVAAVGDDAFVSERVDSINLFEGVQNIGARAFAGCTALRFVYIYSTVPRSVGESAFPDTVQGYFVPLHNVEDYKANEGWKRYADKIVAIETPESINTSIVNVYNAAMANDENLGQLIQNLADNDTALQQAIQNLSAVDNNMQKQIDDITGYSQGLEYAVVSVNDVLGFGVTGKGTCTDTDLVIPPTYNGFPVLSIEAGAFYRDQSSIASVTIPESVVSIGSGAFDWMNDGSGTALYTCKLITCLAKTPPKTDVEEGAWLFFGASQVRVPSESLEAYKVAEGWSTRKSAIIPIETLETLRTAIDNEKNDRNEELEKVQAQVDELASDISAVSYKAESNGMELHRVTEDIHTEVSERATADANLQNNINNVHDTLNGRITGVDSKVGVLGSVSTADVGISTGLGNFAEVHLLMTHNGYFEVCIASVFNWGSDVANVRLTDNRSFSIPVDIAGGVMTLRMSQLSILDSTYAYTGVGKMFIKTV